MERTSDDDSTDTDPTSGPGRPGDESGPDVGDDPEPDIDDVFEELEELEALVDTETERKQVRAARRTLERARRNRTFRRLRDGFDLRDAGEALLGSFLFGIPMVVEDGTFAIGRHVARTPLSFLVTLTLGLGLVVTIFRGAQFQRIEEDFLFSVVPLRLLGILGIAGGFATLLVTLWGRVEWADPMVAAGQTTVVAIVMAVGASLGDVVPET